jgi:Collagen triple helix repeat (20 copies)
VSDTLRIKRRAAGGAAGAPSSLAAAELAFNEQDNTLYYGKGNSSGLATTIIPIAGPGGFLPLSGGVLTGPLTLSADPASALQAATKQYADSRPGPTGATGPQGPAGTAGASGATGPQGPAGASGASGPAGTPGTPGASGASGPGGPGYLATSTTSDTIGLGSHTFTTQAGLAYTIGARARVASRSAPTNWMEGIVTAYSGTSLTINVDTTSATAGLAATGGWSTGDVKMTFKVVADPGWVMMNDGSIGDASSGATSRASSDCANLFALFFGNCTDANVPIQTSTGAATTRAAQGTAGAAWAAHCRLVLPKSLGRALAVAGAGSGLTSRALGLQFGEEAHAQTVAEMPAHAHPGSTTGSSYYTSGGAPWTSQSTADYQACSYTGALNTVAIASQGGSTAFNVMQPTVFLNVMVCL